jgi:predicted Zn-dependent peptidase
MGGEKRATIEAEVQLPRVYRFYHAAPYGHADWIAADLLTSILGLGKASRLERALVYEQQIAQDVAAFILPTEASGMVMMWATAKEGVDPAALEAALDAELAKIVSDGPTDEELMRVRNQTETDFAHQIESYEHRADLLSTFETFFGDANLVTSWIDRYEHVTRDDIRRVAAECLRADERVTIHYVPATEAAR